MSSPIQDYSLLRPLQTRPSAHSRSNQGYFNLTEAFANLNKFDGITLHSDLSCKGVPDTDSLSTQKYILHTTRWVEV